MFITNISSESLKEKGHKENAQRVVISMIIRQEINESAFIFYLVS